MIFDDLQELVSYRRDVTGVDCTIFIASKGSARHGPRLIVGDSLDPRDATASIDLNGRVVGGEIAPTLLRRVQCFITRNRTVLLDYWHYKIDGAQLVRRLRPIGD